MLTPPIYGSASFPNILNISLLVGFCLNWQCFLKWFGSHETLHIILKCFDLKLLNKCKKYLKINIFFFKKLYKQTLQKYYNIFSMSFKQNQKRFLFLIPENIGDRVFIVHKTKMLTEYIRKRYKVFQELNLSNVSIFFIDCQSNAFLLMNIIVSDIFINP